MAGTLKLKVPANFKVMWHRLRNLWSSVETYQTLSPAMGVRRQVNCRLRDRPTLSLAVWGENFRQSHGQSPEIADAAIEFAYTHLQYYCGLEIGKLRPGDRLNEDLCWIEVCGFDWELRLCDDFHQHFGIDISDRLDDLDPATVADLVLFFDRQCRARN